MCMDTLSPLSEVYVALERVDPSHIDGIEENRILYERR